MPISPEDRARYPADWPRISLEIRRRAGNRCECGGQCGDHLGRCGAPHRTSIVRHSANPWQWRTMLELTEAYGCGLPGAPWDGRPVRVILTTAHLDHTPENCDPLNLLSMCQRCHLVYDRAQHAGSRRRNRDKRNGQASLWSDDAA